MKKMILVFLCAILVCSIHPFASLRLVSAETPSGVRQSDGAMPSGEEGFQLALARGPYSLYADFSNGAFYIDDAVNGNRWYSNPPGGDDDWASGFDRMLLVSQLIVRVNMDMDALTPVLTQYASYASNCELTYKLTEDALIFVYDFQKASVKVPLKLMLTDKGFSCELLNDEVVEYGPHQLIQALILPAFGAGGSEDSGYILSPDGSGALIHFNNQKASVNKLDALYYGFNAGVSDRSTSTLEQFKRKKTLSEDLQLPLWGMKVNDSGYLAILRGGAAKTHLMAQSGGQGSGYNMAYPNYYYRETAEVRMLTKGFSQQNVEFAEANPDHTNHFKVEYLFLPRGAATYTDMAAAYRQDLVANGSLSVRETENIPFYLDLYGYIVKQKPYMGIPVNRLIPTTTFGDAAELARLLHEAGVSDIHIRYNYWQKNGYYGKLINNPVPENALGGKKALNGLHEQLAATGGRLFLSHEPMNVYKGGDGFIALFDALKNVARTIQRQYTFSLSNASVDSRYKPWYLLRPQKLETFFEKYLNNFNRNGYGNLSLDSIGRLLYSELANDGINRDEVVRIIDGLLAEAEASYGDLMLNGAYAYAAAHADHIVNTPERSSGYDIYDEDVPFYQIVFHGYAGYSLGATNLSSNPAQMKLKCLETGASPMFSWVVSNADEIIGSRSDHLFSADYRRWFDQAVSDYTEIKAVLSDVAAVPITDHQNLPDKLTLTEYGGSMRVICNYGMTDAMYEGHVIPAGGYEILD